jgi:hypothetical protein
MEASQQIDDFLQIHALPDDYNFSPGTLFPSLSNPPTPSFNSLEVNLNLEDHVDNNELNQILGSPISSCCSLPPISPSAFVNVTNPSSEDPIADVPSSPISEGFPIASIVPPVPAGANIPFYWYPDALAGDTKLEACMRAIISCHPYHFLRAYSQPKNANGNICVTSVPSAPDNFIPCNRQTNYRRRRALEEAITAFLAKQPSSATDIIRFPESYYDFFTVALTIPV